MRLQLLTVSLLFVASCSNGSNEPAVVAPPAIVDADVVITVDNAMTAAQAGVRGSFDFLRLGYIGASFLQTNTPEPPATGGEPGNGGATGSAVIGAVLSTEVPGPDGGSAVFAWEDLDDSGSYSSGDIFTIDFEEYESDGLRLNGVMVIDDLRLQGILPGDNAFIVDATLNLIGLSVTLGAQESSLTLELPFRLENRLLVELFELQLFEPHYFGSFEVREGTRMIRHETDETVRYSVAGAVFSPELDGLVQFYTPKSLIGNPFTSDPTEGKLIIRGAGASMIEVEPSCLAPGFCFSLDLRVDEDGDEEFEDTIVSSWGALLPQ